MHPNWEHLPWAITWGLCGATVTLLAAARQLDQIIRIAIEWYRQIRNQLYVFELRGAVTRPLQDQIAKIRSTLSSNRAALPGTAKQKCNYPCCSSGEFDRFFSSTSRIAVLASLSIFGTDTGKKPTKRTWDFVKRIYSQTHRVWLVEYKHLSAADRRAEFLKLLFTNALRHGRCSHRMAVIIGRQLAVGRITTIATPPSSRCSVKQADDTMCNVI